MQQNQNQQQQIQIKVADQDLKGLYSNAVFIQSNKEEFCLDFLTISPPGGVLLAKIFMSPGHVKRMLNVLGDQLKKHEERFGSVEMAQQPDNTIGFQPK